MNGAMLKSVEALKKIFLQAIDVIFFCQLIVGECVGIKIAIRAFLYAPREVDVEADGDWIHGLGIRARAEASDAFKERFMRCRLAR